MEKAAVIKTGGKQYLVSPGQKIKIERKIEDPQSKNKEIVFDKVLLLIKGDKAEIGIPYVKNAKVTAKIVRQGKGKKVITLKYKAKKREKTKKGHRQPYTEVEIVKISP